MKRFLAFFIGVLFLFAATTSVFAHHKERVLGESTTSAAQIPPTVEGPGLILPDSPLFFLDQIKQSTRLLFAFSPENKAKVRADIAGERMAELRFMLAKKDKKGIDIALQGVVENLGKAAESLNQAQLTGRNVSSLAKDVNEKIKLKQEALDVLEATEDKEIKFKAKSAQEGLLKAKVSVEDSLPEDEIETEIEDDLHRIVEDEVEDASESAERIEHQLRELRKQASDSAEKSLDRRSEMLRRVIEEKDKTLKKSFDKAFQLETKKQEALFKERVRAVDEAQKAVKESQKAAEKFREAREKTMEIKRGEDAGNSGSSINSGSSSNSGPSINSGSDDSEKSGSTSDND